MIRRIVQVVSAAKLSSELRDSYMFYQVKQREAELRGETKGRQEGIAEGKEQQAKEMAFRTIYDAREII